jgi:hypothetical protein
VCEGAGLGREPGVGFAGGVPDQWGGVVVGARGVVVVEDGGLVFWAGGEGGLGGAGDVSVRERSGGRGCRGGCGGSG